MQLSVYWSEVQVSLLSDKPKIVKGYRVLAKKYHPDNLETGNKDIFQIIQNEYEFLLKENPSININYNQTGFYERMFYNTKTAFNQDEIYEIEITPLEMFYGCAKKIMVNKNYNCYYEPCKNKIKCTVCDGVGLRYGNICQECYGTGKMVTDDCEECNGFHSKNEILELIVVIPRGIEHGDIIKHESGLKFKIWISQQQNTQIKGLDIHVFPYFYFYDLILGTKKEIEVLDKKYLIIIPPNTLPNGKLKIKNAGIFSEMKNKTGDVIVNINIKPIKLNENIIESLKKIKEENERNS